MIHLLLEPKPPLFYSSQLCWACLWERASGKTEARLQNGKIGIVRKTVRQQKNVTFCGCSVWICNCSTTPPPPFSVFCSFQSFPLSCYCRSFQLIYANLCSLAGTKPAGRGPLPWLPAVRVGGVWEAGARVTWTDTSFNLIHWSMQQRGSWGEGGR